MKPMGASTARNVSTPYEFVSAPKAFGAHLICSLGLAAALFIAHNIYSTNLMSNPSDTLRLIWLIESPIVICIYSLFRPNPEECEYWKAVGRGLLGLPAGAVINALGAIALGAPVGIHHLPKTINWSLMMSLFTFVPAASVFGSSWTDWQRIFGYTKPVGVADHIICLPAHGAIIGAWFGAWPMPLDWERPWQEWPICVSYGSIFGYLIGMAASHISLLARGCQRIKRE